MIIISDLITVEECAKRCKVQPRAIYARLKNGTISGIRIGNYAFVNPLSSPPKRVMNEFDNLHVPPYKLPDNLKPADLISLGTFVHKKKMRGDWIYTQAMLGKLRSVIICEVVFVPLSEAEEILKYKPK